MLVFSQIGGIGRTVSYPIHGVFTKTLYTGTQA